MYPETRTSSDAHANPALAIKLKYIDVGSAKNMSKKVGGNSGKTGRKHRCKERGHAGGQISTEEKRRREEQSRVSRENQVPKYYR
jgi:hypothetical protein